MIAPVRARARRRALPLALCLVVAGLFVAAPPVLAQAQTQGAEQPWLYRGSDVPVDPEWTFGVLPNGLRYALRHNGVPPEQVSIRVRIDAGSLHERDEERGFAHLIEHLTFRQSKYLGESQAIHAWQRLGATFGSDTNAETSPTHTVYKLDLPNATPASLEETFRLLSGMITAPTLSEANIRSEVPIVLAEMRERGGAGTRVAEATRKALFAGQLLADRSPIGTVPTLQAARQDAVRAFHRRWYRPENTVIVVAGDTAVAEFQRLVQTYFADWKGVGAPTPAPNFGDPVAPAGADPANPVGEVKVIVEPDMPRGFTYATLRPWRQVNDTIEYNRGLMIDWLAQAIINRRLEAKARAGGSFIGAQVSQDDISRSVDATIVSLAPLGDDWQAAVRDVRAVIADALETPPTEEEIARELAEFDVAFASGVEQRRVLAGAKLADDIVNAVDIREAVASPETVLEVFRGMRARFTPQAVLEHTRTLFQGTVTRGIYVSPVAVPGGDAAARMALVTPVKADTGSRLAAKTVKFEDLPAIGAPGKVVSGRPLGVLEIETVTLSNGVKALVWPTDAEPGRVLVKVRFGPGLAGVSAADAPYLGLGDAALLPSGIGALSQEDIDRLTTGRKIGFDMEIEDANFAISAETRPADLNDQLYLMAAKFAQPRWDPAPFVRVREARRQQYDSLSGSPQGVLQRDLDWLTRGRDARYRTPNPAELAKLTPEGFRRVWEPLLARGPIEVDVFGDFKRADAIAALERTFGALPARNANPVGLVVPPLPAASTTPLTLTHRGDANQAAALIAWPTAGGRNAMRESRQLEILSQLFQSRLFDALRETMGASYSPQVANNWPLDLPQGGQLVAMVQVGPDKVPAFFAAAEAIAADLIAKPATQDELTRITEPLKQLINRSSTGNAFWLYQVEGAAFDPSRAATVSSILNDYSRTTPAEMQALAARYLAPGRSWRLQVLPEKGGR